MWFCLSALDTVIVLVLCTDRLRVLWRDLSISPAKTADLLLFLSVSVWWIMTCPLFLGALVDDISDRSRNSRSQKEFSKFAIAYERLTDKDANIEWQLRKEWASSYSFAGIYWLSLVVSCTAWFLASKRMLQQSFPTNLFMQTCNGAVRSTREAIAHVGVIFIKQFQNCQRVLRRVDQTMVLLLSVAIASTYTWHQLHEEYHHLKDDPHEIFGLPKNATVKAVKKAYRAAAIRYHGD